MITFILDEYDDYSMTLIINLREEKRRNLTMHEIENNSEESVSG